jgi:hypothetical protein
MQTQRAVRAAAMQVNRRTEGGDLSETDGDRQTDAQWKQHKHISGQNPKNTTV